MLTSAKRITFIATICAIIVFSCIFCMPAFAAETQPSTPEQTQVTVTSSSTKTVSPDKAKIMLNIEGYGDKPAEAQEKVSEVLENVMKTALSKIDKDDICVTNYSISPDYDYESSQTKIVGYNASVSIAIDNRDVSDVGTIITDAVNAGVNSVGNVSYFSTEYDRLYCEALMEAIKDSKLKADAIAKALGSSVDKCMSVNEGWQNTAYRASGASINKAMDFAEAEAAYDAGELASLYFPEDLEIKAEITVIYSLK